MTGFGAFVQAAHEAGDLVVQPRMGMSDPRLMREGLLATRRAVATTVGTLTLDSYTRVGDHAAVGRALAEGAALNGYPLVHHGPDTTRAVLDGIAGPHFPVQVRHGSAHPEDIFRTMVATGLSATEGGPVSYCLPYSRSPLHASVASWERCCEAFAQLRGSGVEPHLETFGGCMMGQLCPPSLLVALSVLEALFFRAHGLRSVSLSYAQQTNEAQDEEALAALTALARSYLPDLDWHLVVYTYMGVYPRSEAGASLLLEAAAGLAARSGAARLIVKTTAEAHRIPSVAENVTALETAARAAEPELRARRDGLRTAADTGVLAEAQALVETVLELADARGGDLGQALVAAFERGLLDVPYCLHPDNAGRSRSVLDSDGRLLWSDLGRLPLRGIAEPARSERMTSSALLSSLGYVERRFDQAALSAVSHTRPSLTTDQVGTDHPTRPALQNRS
ncbi:methylaspartate mutase epsilon subunit [Streptacidiphilus sp. MAP12-33]|uniref:methylaspartate mutase n=1 Tax=Streptacidiphilus sp. MAP12-33 TaxID=3156266 RepID=UPI003514F939